MSTVSYTWATLPPLTEEDRAEMRALEEKFRNMPDSEIDWARAIPNPFYRAKSEALQEAKV